MTADAPPLTTCRLEVAAGVATITMTRPPVNAQNRAMRVEMTALFDALSDRDDVRAVILTAEGHVFSAGADIKERRGMVRKPGDYLDHNRLTREFFLAVADCACPVICAVNGPAIGAGCALMLYSDIMLASETAWFQMPEIDVGLAGGGRLMAEHFGKSWSRLIYFTGRKLPAAELYRQGVISACLPPADLLPEARRIAAEIAAKDPQAVRWIKRGFSFAETMSPREAYRFEQSITQDLSTTDAAKAAQDAFVARPRGVE